MSETNSEPEAAAGSVSDRSSHPAAPTANGCRLNDDSIVTKLEFYNFNTISSKISILDITRKTDVTLWEQDFNFL